ncbi:hypothetical protein PHYBOEH_002287 [Phytophthora boehmeriae]|uniref:Cation efflux protein cytoplasmic domain-containing protein n=1 Tax=Phytophthora boehmeriae TaxID=109152 RepID=A0A8T1WX87_9STRA|nr:hypothetical protein PHYBOEH_002287 [Phytophthora boehmeriae]
MEVLLRAADERVSWKQDKSDAAPSYSFLPGVYMSTAPIGTSTPVQPEEELPGPRDQPNVEPAIDGDGSKTRVILHGDNTFEYMWSMKRSGARAMEFTVEMEGVWNKPVLNRTRRGEEDQRVSLSANRIRFQRLSNYVFQCIDECLESTGSALPAEILSNSPACRILAGLTKKIANKLGAPVDVMTEKWLPVRGVRLALSKTTRSDEIKLKKFNPYYCERQINHVAVVLKASLFTNIIIVIVMTSVAIASNSLALISALVENMVDLFVQGLLWYAGTRSGKKQDYAKYPAGTSRFEPVAIIVAASVMVLASIVFIQESVTKLLDGFASDEPEAPILSAAAIAIAVTAVIVKIGLMLYSSWILKTTVSAAVEAIHQDNFNDMISNSFAVAAYIVASVEPKAWYVDPAGAILIFLYIMVAWSKMAWEQVTQLVGVCASDEFIEEVKNLCNNHHPSMALDIVRAYHFGSKYLVELEVVVPAEMSVKLAHDIALQVQFKVENLEELACCFS